MPTYVYKREDGSTFEVMQRITEEPLAVCPTTGQKVTRVIGAGAGLIFKGDGFYLTDYARKKSPEPSSSSDKASGDSASNGSAAKAESGTTTESKSDPS